MESYTFIDGSIFDGLMARLKKPVIDMVYLYHQFDRTNPTNPWEVWGLEAPIKKVFEDDVVKDRITVNFTVNTSSVWEAIKQMEETTKKMNNVFGRPTDEEMSKSFYDRVQQYTTLSQVFFGGRLRK